MDNRCLAAFIEAGMKVVVVVIVVVFIDSKSEALKLGRLIVSFVDGVTSRLMSRLEVSGMNIFLQNSGALEFGLLSGKLDVRKPTRLPV